jgi:hypothetical protein
LTAVPVFTRKIKVKNIAVDDDLFAAPGRLERTSLWKEVASRCLELRLTINKRLEAEGGEGVGSGTDVMSADRLPFLHGCCQTLPRRAKVVYRVTVVVVVATILVREHTCIHVETWYEY